MAATFMLSPPSPKIVRDMTAIGNDFANKETLKKAWPSDMRTMKKIRLLRMPILSMKTPPNSGKTVFGHEYTD